MKVKIKMDDVKVIAADAQTLGEIGEFAYIDTATWKVSDLELVLTDDAVRDLGLKKPMFGSLKVCLPTSTIKLTGDVIELNVGVDELRDLKECKPE